jgi:hypothetical protein
MFAGISELYFDLSIISGKTLKNADDSLTDLGVKDGATIMLLGKKVS